MKSLMGQLLTFALLCAVGALGQEPGPRIMVQGTPEGMTTMMFQGAGPQLRKHGERLPGGDMAFFSADILGAEETVKGAPYTATETTESTQVLADGNRIVTKSTANVARDSQGRTRREQSFARLGALDVQGPKMFFINDPTTGTTYTVQPSEQRAIKYGGTIHMRVGDDSVPVTTERIVIQQPHENGAVMKARSPGGEVKHEDLGFQTIEGVSAQGTRDTRTIPAGAIGNERPIDIVTETWYSPDLHIVVLRKFSDPRMGETVTRTSDIKRAEPDASLFQVPNNFKLESMPVPRLRMEGLPSKQQLPY